MAMVQCENGHLFDDARHKTCPFCYETEGDTTQKLDESAEMPLMGTIPLEPIREPVWQPLVGMHDEDVMYQRLTVGWLTCITGAQCGRSFEVKDARNKIGRGKLNDIRLDFDNVISEGPNVIIAYDSENNKCFIYLGDSKNNIYVNDKLLMVPVELKDYDIIDFGSTKLIFRTLCNERFNWESVKKDDFVRVDGLEKNEGKSEQNGNVDKMDIPLAGALAPLPAEKPEKTKKQKKPFHLFKMFGAEKKFKPEENIMPCVYASPGNFGTSAKSKK